MGKIFVVRHGQDEDNANLILNGRRNRPLTALGRKQAKAVASELKKHNIDVIYSSPLKRAFETAQIIAKELEIAEVITHEELVERDFGILSGRPYSDVPKYATKTFQSKEILFLLEGEGIEDFPTVYKRAQKVLYEIQKKHPYQTVLLVAHGDINKMLQAVHHGWEWEETLQKPYFANTEIVELTF